MIIGLDASGTFAALEGDGFECSAVAAVALPVSTRNEICKWTKSKLGEWRRAGLKELHAQEMDWPERLETCQMFSERDDIHVAVVLTNSMLLRSAGAVANHRKRQLQFAEKSLAAATSDAGRRRGEAVCRLLGGERIRQSRLSDQDYVQGAMAPRAIFDAVQRAICFFAGEKWRAEMPGFEVVVDRDTPPSLRYIAETLLPVLGSDAQRFQWIMPEHWSKEPQHPLLIASRHPDGEGYWVKGVLGKSIEPLDSEEEPAIQIADVAAWVTCRAVSHPDESAARECFELLRPALTGERGRCFEVFAAADIGPTDDVLYRHLQQHEQPEAWLVKPSIGADRFER